MFPSLRFFDRKRILLLAHVHADPDSMGSCIALFHALKNSAKPQIGVCDHANVAAQRMAYACATTFSTNPRPIESFDAIVLLDFNSREMAGSLAVALERLRPRLFAIDHHCGVTSALAPENHQWLDTQCPANAQLVYSYLKKNRTRFNPPMALALAAALVSDTHRFERANAKTFEALSELIPRTKWPYEKLAAIFSGTRDDSERKAILLALSRSSIETIGSWLVASSQVSAFGHEAAGQLVFAGADLALVESAFDDETRLFARASSRLKKAGFSIPVHLFTGLEGQGLGSGGGHDTAGAFRSEKSRPLGALIQAALQLCSTQLPSRT